MYVAHQVNTGGYGWSTTVGPLSGKLNHAYQSTHRKGRQRYILFVSRRPGGRDFDKPDFTIRRLAISDFDAGAGKSRSGGGRNLRRNRIAGGVHFVLGRKRERNG